MPRLGSSLLLSLLIASSASAVTMDWTFIGGPGNPADSQVMEDGTTGYGSVAYAYSIGTYEVTNAQYAEFLSAKAKSDPLALYNTSMAGFFGGITRSGVSGSFTYNTIAGRESMPVNFVSFSDAMRFANWMNNGQGSASTETGAYTLLGGTATPSNGTTVVRNANATIFLASENEWYKAAYYSALTASYFDFPTGSNTPTVCSGPTATPNRANCNGAAQPPLGIPTNVGSYSGSASPYGTFDQGGNVWEWNEAIISGLYREIRGGVFHSGDPGSGLAASARYGLPPTYEDLDSGFRIAMIPEPSTGLLVIAGLLGIGVRRRVCD